MAIALALTTQCPYCIEVHRQAAVEMGVTEKELAEVVFVASALRAGGAITRHSSLAGMKKQDLSGAERPHNPLGT